MDLLVDLEFAVLVPSIHTEGQGDRGGVGPPSITVALAAVIADIRRERPICERPSQEVGQGREVPRHRSCQRFAGPVQRSTSQSPTTGAGTGARAMVRCAMTACSMAYVAG